MAVLSGNSAANSMFGTANRDKIAGYSGNDRINPGAGSDTAIGGPGADVFYWDEVKGSTRSIDNYSGGDWQEGYDPNPYGTLSGGDRLIIGSESGDGGFRVVFHDTEGGRARDAYGNLLNFKGIERIETGAGNDTIIGTNAVILPGRNPGGSENHTPVHGLTILAGAGNDLIRGSNADDVLDGGEGNDRYYGGDGNDFLMASAGNDYGHGGGGDDNIRWGNNGGTGPIHDIGRDTLIGGEGSDLLNLWATSESRDNSIGTVVTLTGSGSGHATFARDNGTVVFREFEQFWTHQGQDTVSAANADIELNGRGIMFNTRWGDDMLTGSDGRDTLEGGEGADTVNGGRGNDNISLYDSIHISNGASVAPDASRDVLVIEDDAGVDRVRAFQVGGPNGDRLDVSRLHDADGNLVNINDVRVTEQNGSAVLIFSNGEQVIFEGVDSSSLTRDVLIEIGIPASVAQEPLDRGLSPAPEKQADDLLVPISAEIDPADGPEPVADQAGYEDVPEAVPGAFFSADALEFFWG